MNSTVVRNTLPDDLTPPARKDNRPRKDDVMVVFEKSDTEPGKHVAVCVVPFGDKTETWRVVIGHNSYNMDIVDIVAVLKSICICTTACVRGFALEGVAKVYAD